MKNPRLAIVLLAGLWLAFAAYVWFTAAQLPERVATHFGANGTPNGWMTRTGHVQFMLIFGTLVPAFVLGTFMLIRRLRGWGLNIPHKEYWLAPERQQATYDFIHRQGFWLAGLLMAFLAGVHYSILAANARSPVALPMTDFVWITGGFLAATLLWAAIFMRRFYRKPA